MKTIIFCLLTIGISSLLYCQSSIVYGTSTNIDVGTGADVSAGTITVNGTYTGSGTFNNGPLPVELVSFNALIVKNKVELNWATATEVNNYGFEIERSVVSVQSSVISGQISEWQKIGFVQGNGNSNSPKEYSFADNSATTGKYAYRLKQIDNDGTYKYSNEIEVDLGIPVEFLLQQNYPNPFNPETVINYQLPVSGNVSLKVFDMLGREVATIVNEVQKAGTYDVSFNGKDLTSGVYFFRLQAGDFIKINKMTLMK
ncbi:MAG: T9SS type A sorting domain-containing protein [Ignavibacteria bacterium]|nr:T9SS type A sorting domain-containing protein [Ignavibacteria bacterium]